ncbi:MAG: hypothetical protein AABW90_03205 [Nanoarchaeota archaeon]
MNKKGLELAINTIVILVLAIVILLFLVLFFTEAGKDFFKKIRGYSSEVNVDEIITSCNILADTNSVYEFCCGKKVVKYYKNDKKIEGDFSCNELTNKTFINNKISSLDCGKIKC